MKWKPISEADIIGLINESWERMSIPQRRFWEVVNVYPIKWKQKPWGSKGIGFWVVAIIGNTVVWYNDIEDGFNRSNYKKCGEIDQYRCNQDELELQIQQIINEIENGQASGGHFGAPQPIA